MLQEQPLHKFVWKKTSLPVCAELIQLNNNLDRNSFGFGWVTAVIQFAAEPRFHICHDNSGGGEKMGTSSGQGAWWLLKLV